MKKKNLALRMSACMMSALLVVGSAAPAYAAEDMVFADQAADVSEDVADAEAEDVLADDVTEDGEVQVAEDGEDLGAEDVQSGEADLDADDPEELFADEPGDAAGSSEDVFADTDAQAAEVQSGFGTGNTQLAAGTYQVTVSLKKADNITADSMAGSCIAGKGTLVVAEDGSAKLTVPIQAVNVMGQTAYAKDWKVYSNGLNSETTDAEFTADENGNVNSITFAIPDKAQDGVYVSMYIDLMQSTQDAYCIWKFLCRRKYECCLCISG